MKELFVLALLLVLFIPAGNAASTTPALIQENGVMVHDFSQSLSWTQSGSGEFAGSGTSGSFIQNLTVPYTSIVSSLATMKFTASGNIPMVNVTQSTTLLNATIPYAFVVGPTVGKQSVTDRVVALFQPSGGVVATGTYPVSVGIQQSIEFADTSVPSWTYSGLNATLNYTVDVQSGWSLNQSTVFLPFPSVNITTVNVTLEGKAWGQYIEEQNGVLVTIPTLTSSEYVKVILGFAPNSEGIVVLNLGNPTYNGVSEQVTISYVDNKAAYAGAYLFTDNYTYSINAGSINISASGKYVPAVDIVTIGNYIEILPGAVTVLSGRAVVFTLKFTFQNAPPSLSLTLGSTLGPVTVGGILITGMLALLAFAIVAYFTPVLWRRKELMNAVFALFILLLIIYIAVGVVG